MKKSILVGLMLLLTTLTYAQKKFYLKLNYAKGDVFKQTITSDQKVEMMGMSIPQTMVMEVKNEIQEVNKDGSFNIKMTYTRMAMKQENPMMGTIEFDSDKEDNNESLLATLGAIVNKSFVVKMSAKGEILEVIDSEIEGGKETLKQTMNGITVAYPEGKVKVGSTWEGKLKMEAQKMESVNTYKIVEVKGDEVKVEVKSKMKSTEDNKEVGEQSGSMLIDKKTGLVIDMSIDQKIQMTQQGMELTLNGTTKLVTKK